jgi:hypothetical protein
MRVTTPHLDAMNHALIAKALCNAYGLYTAAALLLIALVWFFARETKGKELERM